MLIFLNIPSIAQIVRNFSVVKKNSSNNVLNDTANSSTENLLSNHNSAKLASNSSADTTVEKFTSETAQQPNASYFDILIDWIKTNKPTKRQIHEKKRKLCHQFGRRFVPTDIEVYMNASQPDSLLIKQYLQTKPSRSASGVAVVATMTAPSICPHGSCTYCPGGIGSVFGDTPKSYTGNEPSSLRAKRNEYDPYRIIFNRLQQYILLGQHPDKVEQIIQGGTFPSYDAKYQEDFCYYSFKAYNDFSREFFARVDKTDSLNAASTDDYTFLLDKFREFFELPCQVGDKSRQERIKTKILALKEVGKKNLEEEQVDNETAAIRCIGLTIETKPDWGFAKHGIDFLRLGATRVELGVQTVYDDILQAVHRGHTIDDTHQSIHELRDLGFKLNFHIMPGLPTTSGARIETSKDIDSIKTIFDDPNYRPDMIKIYPCMVMNGTPLEKMWKAGKYSPLTTQEAAEIVVEAFRYVPEWCRIMRIQRDIPTWATTAGVDRTNLRQYVDEIAKGRGIASKDIRAREPRLITQTGEPQLMVREYMAADGKEFFISLEIPAKSTDDAHAKNNNSNNNATYANADSNNIAKNNNATANNAKNNNTDAAKNNITPSHANDTLLGFTRLRFPSQCLHPAITPTSALIRELHVYGSTVSIGTQDAGKVQHRGFGKQLMAKAEEIAKAHGKNKIIVISGVGVRGYYRKLGYEREGPYMVKKL